MPSPWPLELTDGDLLLRPLRRRDRRAFEALLAENRDWLRAWDATDPVGDRARPPFATLLRWTHQQARARAMIPLLITRRGAILGQVSASPILYGPQSSAVIGYWVGSAHAGAGIAPRAVALLADHLFAEAGLHRIEVNIRPENAASLRVAEKLHLREEGLRRAFIHVDGAFRDHLSFALTAEEVATDASGRGVLRRYLAEHHSDGNGHPGAS